MYEDTLDDHGAGKALRASERVRDRTNESERASERERDTDREST